jgi:rare lipoprotein A
MTYVRSGKLSMLVLALALAWTGCAGTSPTRSAAVDRLFDDAPAPTVIRRDPPALQFGRASFYGPGFHGERTASGDIFDQEALTAAHPTMKFGSRLRVTNLENGSTVLVTVNDRGPFVKGRVIDLSKAAARTLGFLREGTARVRLDRAS